MTERPRPRAAYYTRVPTDFGPMLIAGDGSRVIAVKYDVPAKRLAAAIDDLSDDLRGRYVLMPDDGRMWPAARQVREYLAGRLTSFDLTLDLSQRTPFQRRVLQTTYRIPRGQVASYAEVARRAGYPGAHRAVGSTMRINPIPIVIPCHRVVGSDGIGGYGLGLDVKRRLLALEGVAIAP